MDDIVIVKVFNTVKSLAKEFECFGLSKYVFGVLVIEQITTFGVVHDHIDCVLFEHSVPEFDNVWMVEFGVHFDFSLN